MFTIEFTNEWTGVTFSIDFLTIYCDMHFRKFTFRAANIFLDEFV